MKTFSGFFNIPDIGADTTVSARKDVLVKLQLSLLNCTGQFHDGASNMLLHKTGVAKIFNRKLILLTAMDMR